ncbi:AAA family ATPase [Streptomyces sp. NBC_00076]|uniref:AAA family ATPase n=1 Tax=Streptomyces sp. NBC_00076 TaxID=2975642 RepID=UPI0032531127
MTSSHQPAQPADPATRAILDQLPTLTHRGMVVDSPPGAGKTTLVARAAGILTRPGHPCAVIAQTNTQVDDLVLRLTNLHPRLSIARLTATQYTVPDSLLTLPRVRASTRIQDLKTAQVIVGTALKWATVTDRHWPWAIIDEAYQMRSGTLLRTAGLFDQTLFVGDPGQLDPFSEIDTSRWEGLPHHPVNSAAAVVLDKNRDLPLHSLPVSWRLPPSAVPLINKAFYPSTSFRAGTHETQRTLAFTAKGIRTPLDATIEHAARTGWALLELPARCTHRIDLEALHTTLALAERLLIRQATTTCELNPEGQVLRPADIAIGTAHSVQAERLRSLQAQHYPRLHGISIGTANRLQGHQCSVTLVLHPLSGRTDASAFHLEAGRLCVLTSRHRHTCIVVARAGIADVLDTHPCDEPVYLGAPSKIPDGWEANHTVLQHLTHHTIQA